MLEEHFILDAQVTHLGRRKKFSDERLCRRKGNVGAMQKLERLKERVHFVGVGARPRHTVFVDSDAEARSFSAEAYFDTPAELLGRTFNRPRRAQLAEVGTVSGPPEGPGSGPAPHSSDIER